MAFACAWTRGYDSHWVLGSSVDIPNWFFSMFVTIFMVLIQQRWFTLSQKLDILPVLCLAQYFFSGVTVASVSRCMSCRSSLGSCWRAVLNPETNITASLRSKGEAWSSSGRLPIAVLIEMTSIIAFGQTLSASLSIYFSRGSLGWSSFTWSSGCCWVLNSAMRSRLLVLNFTYGIFISHWWSDHHRARQTSKCKFWMITKNKRCHAVTRSKRFRVALTEVILSNFREFAWRRSLSLAKHLLEVCKRTSFGLNYSIDSRSI